jgi:two-component system NtrC family sensor kinase
MSLIPDSMLADPQQIIANLRRELDECQAERDKAQRNLNETTTERDAALAREAAMAEVLEVINSSPGDLTPVFDAMLEKAMRLCGASFGFLDTFDGERFRTAALHGVPEVFAEFRKHNPPSYGPGTMQARLLAGERLVHVIDLRAEDVYRRGEPNRRALVELGGARTALLVPLLKDEALLGFIAAYRQEVRPFTDKQIALLQNFAAQAVIAMENARLIDEIRQRQAELRVTFGHLGVKAGWRRLAPGSRAVWGQVTAAITPSSRSC